MKPVLPLILILALFAGCSSNPIMEETTSYTYRVEGESPVMPVGIMYLSGDSVYSAVTTTLPWEINVDAVGPAAITLLPCYLCSLSTKIISSRGRVLSENTAASDVADRWVATGALYGLVEVDLFQRTSAEGSSVDERRLVRTPAAVQLRHETETEVVAAVLAYLPGVQDPFQLGFYNSQAGGLDMKVNVGGR